jgi:transposase-like protein
MDDETLRKMAIQHYLQDKSPASIYRDMGRSKKWFFKWLRRYQSGNPNWYHDQSRAPRSHPNQTSPEMRQLIINIRTQLEEHPYAQIGTSAINWEFKKLGATPPSNSTINRTLKRQGFVKKNSLYSQGGPIPLFQRAFGDQSHPSGRSPGSQVHQERWTFPFAQCYRSLEPPSFSQSPTKERRRGRSLGLDPLLEDHGNPRFSPIRQRTLFPWKQSLPSLLWHRSETLPGHGYRGGIHPYRRTLA